MAHKKGQGATRNGRDSKAQFRGVKVFGGQPDAADVSTVATNSMLCGRRLMRGVLTR